MTSNQASFAHTRSRIVTTYWATQCIWSAYIRVQIPATRLYMRLR